MSATAKVQSILTWQKNKKSPEQELRALMDNLGPDEIRILLRVARRLEFGRQRYGDMKLRTDKRNFAENAAEELLDWLVYTECELERAAQRKTRRRK